MLLLILLAAWMPVFLIGVWYKRASQKFSILRFGKDIIVNVILPTAILSAVPKYLQPWTILQRYVPDIVLVLWVVAGALYFGALLKLIQSIILVIRHKLHWDNKESETGEAAEKPEEQEVEVMELQIAEPEEPIELAEPTESEEPIELAEPTESEEPIELAEPTEWKEPTKETDEK